MKEGHTLEEALKILDISQPTLNFERREAKIRGVDMTPVPVLNKKTGNFVKGLTDGQIREMIRMRSALRVGCKL